ncbi:MAG: hypothetical protein CMG59_03980 [Candidatus Marinimicrobia bacterium]|nr:hypothetical protein [Candidatus Neomarinimicrobiota bacterium]
MSKNVLITGGLGQLGSKLYCDLSSSYNVINSSRNGQSNTLKLDVADSNNMSKTIRKLSPDIILNCSSFNNVDNCEIEKDSARSVIVGGIRNLIKFSKKKCRIIHISSDYIFDGTKGDYLENDAPSPLNYYGRLKLEAENLLRSSNRDYAIIRCSTIFSHDLKCKSNFFGWVYNSLKAKKNINVVKDQISCPTPVELISKFINIIMPLNSNGIFNLGIAESYSRFDFAMKICKAFDFDEKLIHPVRTKDLSQKAIRPKNTTLNIAKINTELDIDIYSLSYYIDKLKDVIIE